MMARKAAVALCLAFCAALIVAPWAGHLDDSDAHLYTVLARHMAADGAWFDLRYLPGVHPRFREHLPFGFWPYAAALRLFGEGALPWLGALASLGTLALVLWIGERLAGLRAGLVAAMLLAATESFFRYAGQPRLDPWLMLLATASAAPLLVAREPRYAVAAVFGALAALVKGPFGLLPLAAAGIARAVALRSWRELWRAGAACAAASLPAAAFLAASPGWREGYLVRQLLASAGGGRPDGEQGALQPFVTVAGRFWPGLPLVFVGLFAARRNGAAFLIGLWSLALLLLLCVPARKVWHHSLVAYPALALLAGVGVAAWLDRLRPRAFWTGLATLSAAAVIASAAGAGRLLMRPCILDPLRPLLPRAGDILVVAPQADWKMVAALAAELRLVPWPQSELAGRAAVAVVRDDAKVDRSGWVEHGRGGGWTLLKAHR